MTIYPAIDIKDGQCVRLLQGRMEDATVYGQNPAAMAMRFQEAGAKWIHVVDLNGAFEGDSVNLEAIRGIVEVVDANVQVGGGIRTMAQIDRMLGIGVSRVILGTAALKNPQLVQEAVDKYGYRIAVGIDAKDGYVAINGWAEATEMTAIELGKRVAEAGVKTVIYTDISKDGMMVGPNFESTKELIDTTGLDIILSGGVSRMEDVKQAAEIGAAGAIAGKAIYTGAIDLNEALKWEATSC